MLATAVAYGIRRSADESLREFGLRVGTEAVEALMALYERALFADVFTEVQERETRRAAARAAIELRELVPLWRRILSALDPRPRLRSGRTKGTVV